MNLPVLFVVLFYLLGLIVGPLAIAVVSKLWNGTGVSDWAIGVGLKSVWRPSLTFDAANELTLKRRHLDENHDSEQITFSTGVLGSAKRHIFDPRNRTHDLFATPFSFVDERFGIVVDPRDVLVGRLLEDAQETGTYTLRREKGETIREAVLGVFEVPGEYVGTRLPDVWTLVGGSLDSQLVDLIHEYYQKGQAPRESTTALRQLLLPVGTFIAILLIGMFASSQGGGGGAPAPTNSTNINIGQSIVAFALISTIGIDREWKNKSIVGVIGLLAAGLFGLIHFAMPLWVTILGIPLPLAAWSAIGLGLGAATLPIVSAWFGRSLGGLGVVLGQLWITIGMIGYDQPVITLVGPNEYDLVEYDSVDEWNHEPAWYRFAMSRIGVGLANDVDVWGEQYVESPARVDEMGSTSDNGISPPQHQPTDLIGVENIGSYVPEDVTDDATYVRTDLTTGWFLEAGQNKRLMKTALETAKKKFGGGNKPVGDRLILMATLAAMVLGAVFDWMVFF